MPTYRTILTDLGKAKIATAIANAGTVQLEEMAVGDGNGNPTAPSPAQTALVRETHRTTLSSLTTDSNNPNWLLAEMVIPATVGGFTVREVGVFDDDGDLIAVANFPDIYKPLDSEGTTRDLVIRVTLEVEDTNVVTVVIDPNVAIATRQWVEGNFSLAVLIPGGTTGMVLRKASNADGDVEWYDATSGLNIIVDVVEEEQTLADSQTIVTLATATTDSLAVYVEGARLHPGEFTIDSATQITLATSYPAGSKILMVQNEPTAGLTFLRTANNLSEIAGAGGVAQASARTNLGLDSIANIVAAAKTAVFDILYPIGELLITRRSANPSTWLGFGTWEAYGAGRTLVGIDGTDSAFNELDKTGGAKTHTLTTAELPSHTHTIDPPVTATSTAADHAHTIDPPATATNADGDHTHLAPSTDNTVGSYEVGRPAPAADGGTQTGYDYLASAPTTSDGAHQHTVDIAPFSSAPAGSHQHTVDIPAFSSAAAGSGSAHNNLQPYIVVFFWKRTA